MADNHLRAKAFKALCSLEFDQGYETVILDIKQKQLFELLQLLFHTQFGDKTFGIYIKHSRSIIRNVIKSQYTYVILSCDLPLSLFQNILCLTLPERIRLAPPSRGFRTAVAPLLHRCCTVIAPLLRRCYAVVTPRFDRSV